MSEAPDIKKLQAAVKGASLMMSIEKKIEALLTPGLDTDLVSVTLTKEEAAMVCSMVAKLLLG